MMVRDILQDSLARVERGEAPDEVLASCASSEERDELASLLALATNIRRVAPTMSENVKARVRYQLYGAMRAHPVPRARPAWQTWLARVALTCLVVLLLGSGTFVAIAESAPGKPLFPARAALNETRVRLITDPTLAITIYLDIAQDRVDDVRILKERGLLSEAPIFLMVGATENLMVTLERYPHAASRALLERARRLVVGERALLRDLIKAAPVERARHNAETLYQLSEAWLPLINRLLDQVH